MGSKGWNIPTAVSLLQKLDAVINDVEIWINSVQGKTLKNSSKKLKDDYEKLRQHVERNFPSAKKLSINKACDGLWKVMKDSPQLLSESAALKRNDVWNRDKAIQFLVKLVKIIEVIETWYGKLAPVIDEGKGVTPNSDNLWRKLNDHDTEFATSFNGVTKPQKLLAITGAINRLVSYMESNPDMFSRYAKESAAQEGSKGNYRPSFQSHVPAPKPNERPLSSADKRDKATDKQPSRGKSADQKRMKEASIQNAAETPRSSADKRETARDKQPSKDPANKRPEAPKYDAYERQLEKLQHHEQQLAMRESYIEEQERKLSNERAKIKAHIEDMSEEIESLQAKNKSLTEQLSHQMHTKISANEENLENISIKNRPVNIAEEYQSLMSHQWMNAMEGLDKQKVNSQNAHWLLYSILKVAENKTSERFKMLMDHLKGPLGLKSSSAPSKTEIPQATINGLGDFWRNTADNADMTSLAKIIHEEMQTTQHAAIYKQMCKVESVTLFIQEAALLGWKMALQRPPMEFKDVKQGTAWNKKKQDVFFESADPATYPVAYSISPMIYHGDQLMVKAKVVCGKLK